MISPSRRSFLALAAAAAAPATLLPRAGSAQPAIPDRGIRVVVGFGTGTGVDLTARILAPQLERRTGRRFIVENKPGEAGTIAGEMLKNGPDDGSTLAIIPGMTIAAKLTLKSYPFDPLADLAPVGMIGSVPLAVAVSPKLGIDTFEDYLATLRGGGTESLRLGCTVQSDAFVKVYARMVNGAFGAKMNLVPYRVAASLVGDLEQGRIPAAVTSLSTLLSAHRGNRLQIVLLSGDKRTPVAPKLPTAADRGLKGFDLREWCALFTGAKAPPATVDAWNQHLRNLLEEPGVRGQLRQLGLDVQGSTPEEAREEVVGTLRDWKTRMDALGVASAN